MIISFSSFSSLGYNFVLADFNYLNIFPGIQIMSYRSNGNCQNQIFSVSAVMKLRHAVHSVFGAEFLFKAEFIQSFQVCYPRKKNIATIPSASSGRAKSHFSFTECRHAVSSPSRPDIYFYVINNHIVKKGGTHDECPEAR